MRGRRKASDLTVTDMFCGAGGSSQGAEESGFRIRMAMNHWSLAIETHNTNFPNADHDCSDVSATDPRRYPTTDVLIASPECTNHSLAKGVRRKGRQQGDLFETTKEDPSAVRSRATMWDVVRFAEFHRYEAVIVENVVDARFWECWEAWLLAMLNLGYEHELVYLNSMFAHPTPQSRDRLYIVFWRKGNRRPDLRYTPAAWCAPCGRDVEARQAWKPGRTWGRYRRQYVYACPGCASIVEPYYYAALNAIDLTLPAERIGDRKRPLKERTLNRIRYGLEKYGRQPLQIVTNMTTDGGRVRAATEPGFTQPGSAITALLSPFVVETAFAHSGERRVHAGVEPLPTQSTRQTFGLAVPAAAVFNYRSNGGGDYSLRSLADPMPAQVTEPQGRLISTAPTLLSGAGVMTYRTSRGDAQIDGSAVMSMRDAPNYPLSGIGDALPTQTASASQCALLQRQPYLISYYGQGLAAPIGSAMPTVTTRDRQALIDPTAELSIEDCYFRMLVAREVGRAMAFRDGYVVLGTARDQVRQYGNAVTPPALRWLSKRVRQALTGERAA